jgi:hypothetical protein
VLLCLHGSWSLAPSPPSIGQLQLASCASIL